MRRLVALFAFLALCAVLVVPEARPVRRAASAGAEAALHSGREAMQAASEALGGQSSPGSGGWWLSGKHPASGAGRAALNDRLTAHVDRHADGVARSAPASAERSVDALAAYLNRHAGPTMRGRTRAAFRWVADHVAYDVSLTAAERRARDTQSPSTVLRTRKAVCEGYARLFVALAEKMGLEAAFIGGHADPAGPGGGGSHAWSSLKLADGWYLLDPTWAAGHVNNGRFVSRFDERWWLVPPERMQLTHTPEDDAWLLGGDDPTQPGLTGQLFE